LLGRFQLEAAQEVIDLLHRLADPVQNHGLPQRDVNVVRRIKANGAKAWKAAVAGMPVVLVVGRPSDPGLIGMHRIEQVGAFAIKALLKRMLLWPHFLSYAC
jgi:hypothetical protein